MKKTFFLILLLSIFTSSTLFSAENKPICKLNKTVFNDKEKAKLSFKKGRLLITKNQNNTISKEFIEGFQCLLASISLDNTKANYFSFLGDTYNLLGLNNMTKAKLLALDSYNTALNLDKDLNDVKIKIANIYIKEGLYEQALDYFESALNTSAIYLEPNILSWMNIAYITAPQTSRGIEFYTKLANKFPRADILNIYKAILLKTQNNKKEAAKTLLKVIANPNANESTVDIAYKMLKEIK